MNSLNLIEELISSTNNYISTAEKLKQKSEDELHWKVSPESWSILECLEHLNLYSDFYIPEITRAISASDSAAEPEFKSGLIGGYFVKSILPREKLNKIKTTKDKDPINNKLDQTTIERFITNQNSFVALLEKAKIVDLNKVKTKISITNLIKIKLGDTLMFLNNHNFRHLLQIERITKHQHS